jgi:hypothetical protein
VLDNEIVEKDIEFLENLTKTVMQGVDKKPDGRVFANLADPPDWLSSSSSSNNNPPPGGRSRRGSEIDEELVFGDDVDENIRAIRSANARASRGCQDLGSRLVQLQTQIRGARVMSIPEVTRFDEETLGFTATPTTVKC